eukprot:8990657-Pyramimonas_sp.AAC.2
MVQRGLMDPEKEDPFSMFVASTNIRYCYYSETHKILGNTFGMCVLQVGVFATTWAVVQPSLSFLVFPRVMINLSAWVSQDFEALTPNLLARTIETVEGGGLVVLLVSSMESLSKLYTLTMVCTSPA